MLYNIIVMNIYKLNLYFFSFIFILLFSNCKRLNMNDENGALVPLTVDYDSKLPSLEINNTKLHLETFGDIHDPIIIFIPGGPGTDYSGYINCIGKPIQSRYLDQRNNTLLGINKLSEEYFCVFFDPRGAGLSPRFDKGEITLDKYHEDLQAIINHFIELKFEETGIKDSLVVLGGHSFGGLYATSFINKYPEKVSHIILFEPAPLSKDVLQKLIQTSVFKMTDEKWLNQYLYSLEHISYNDHVQADYHRILGFSESFPELAYQNNVPIWRYGAYVNAELETETFRSDKFNITDKLSNYKGKTLFIWGEKTTALDQNGVKMQMSFFSNPISKIIPNAGHYMTYENPEACVAEIKSFLK